MESSINSRNEIPCRDCLIFPLCQSVLIEYINSYSAPEDSVKLLAYVITLQKRCSLLSDYIDEGFQSQKGEKKGLTRYTLGELRKVFNI